MNNPNLNLNNLPFETAKIIESLNKEEQQIFFQHYTKLKQKKPFLYFCLFFGFSHYLKMGKPIYTWLGLLTAIIIPYSINLLILVDLFRLPKMIREYNSSLATMLVNKIKQSGQGFNIKEITTSNYSLKEIITHIFINSPKKLSPVILGLKENVICAIVWLILISTLLYNAVNYDAKDTKISNSSSNKSNSKITTKKKMVTNAAGCKDKDVVKLVEELANEILTRDGDYSTYIDKVYDIKETGYNPKLKRRLCIAKLKAVSSDDKGKYATLGLKYTTTKNRVDIEGKWFLISNNNLL